MIISRAFEEYPFVGSFYSYGVNESLPLEEQHDEETLVLETECDIQESSKTDAYGVDTVSYNIYFPFDKNVPISVKRGMRFKGSKYGLEVNGEVIGVDPSAVGGCACRIKDLDVDL